MPATSTQRGDQPRQVTRRPHELESAALNCCDEMGSDLGIGGSARNDPVAALLSLHQVTQRRRHRRREMAMELVAAQISDNLLNILVAHTHNRVQQNLARPPAMRRLVQPDPGQHAVVERQREDQAGSLLEAEITQTLGNHIDTYRRHQLRCTTHTGVGPIGTLGVRPAAAAFARPEHRRSTESPGTPSADSASDPPRDRSSPRRNTGYRTAAQRTDPAAGEHRQPPP